MCRFFSLGERARALEHDVDVQRFPRQARRALCTQQLEPVVTNLQVSVVGCFDCLLIPPVDVLIEEVLDIARRANVVGGDQIQPSRVHDD
jgi:hypothetical protein